MKGGIISGINVVGPFKGSSLIFYLFVDGN